MIIVIFHRPLRQGLCTCSGTWTTGSKPLFYGINRHYICPGTKPIVPGSYKHTCPYPPSSSSEVYWTKCTNTFSWDILLYICIIFAVNFRLCTLGSHLLANVGTSRIFEREVWEQQLVLQGSLLPATIPHARAGRPCDRSSKGDFLQVPQAGKNLPFLLSFPSMLSDMFPPLLSHSSPPPIHYCHCCCPQMT